MHKNATTTPTKFGKLIRDALERKDRSQAWLARQIGGTEAQVSRWISGAEPSVTTVVDLARILDVPLPKFAKALGGRKQKRAAAS